MISNEDNEEIYGDKNEALWEEIETSISNESSKSANIITLMALSGALATVGILSNAIHIVVAAMVLAPGFLPIIRIPIRLIIKNRLWYYGLIDSAKGYGAMILGAIITTLLFQWLNVDINGSKESYYPISKNLFLTGAPFLS